MNNGQTVWATETVALPSIGMKNALTKTGLYSHFLLSTVCCKGGHKTSAQLSRANEPRMAEILIRALRNVVHSR